MSLGVAAEATFGAEPDATVPARLRGGARLATYAAALMPAISVTIAISQPAARGTIKSPTRVDPCARRVRVTRVLTWVGVPTNIRPRRPRGTKGDEMNAPQTAAWGLVR